MTVNNIDPADKALANEFGKYISEVSKIIIKPLTETTDKSLADLQTTTTTVTTKTHSLLEHHIQMFSQKSDEITSTFKEIKDEMKASVEVIEKGHTQTREELINYAKEHSNKARDEMRILVKEQEKYMIKILDSKLTEFNQETLSIIEKSNLERMKKLERKIYMGIGIGIMILIIQIAPIAVLYL